MAVRACACTGCRCPHEVSHPPVSVIGHFTHRRVGAHVQEAVIRDRGADQIVLPRIEREGRHALECGHVDANDTPRGSICAKESRVPRGCRRGEIVLAGVEGDGVDAAEGRRRSLGRLARRMRAGRGRRNLRYVCWGSVGSCLNVCGYTSYKTGSSSVCDCSM